MSYSAPVTRPGPIAKGSHQMEYMTEFEELGLTREEIGVCYTMGVLAEEIGHALVHDMALYGLPRQPVTREYIIDMVYRKASARYGESME